MARKSLFSLFGCLVAAATGLLAAPSTRADVLDAVNWARLQGCARPAHEALREDVRLREAADRMARGSSLRAALSDVGYQASRSAVIQVSGGMADARLMALFVNQDCEVLADTGIAEMGAQRGGRDLWVVLATPAALPVSADAASISRQILDLANAARAAGRRCGNKVYPPAPALALNAELTRAALAHSQEMATYNEFEHSGHDGSSPAARVARTGYAYRIVGENIAAGALSPAEVMQGWLNSPHHCENIMDTSFAEMGIAYAVNRGDSERVFWTQNFAAPADGPR